MPRELPHPSEVVDALWWLKRGAPAFPTRGKMTPRVAIRLLIRLLEALPGYLPVYCHGSPAWRKAMGLPEDETPETDRHESGSPSEDEKRPVRDDAAPGASAAVPGVPAKDGDEAGGRGRAGGGDPGLPVVRAREEVTQGEPSQAVFKR